MRLLTASGDDLTASDDPTRKMMRQIAGAFAEYEKARLVVPAAACPRARPPRDGKCEGRKPHAELHPDVEAEAKRLWASPKTGDRPSYRQISARLAEQGFLTSASSLQSEVRALDARWIVSAGTTPFPAP